MHGLGNTAAAYEEYNSHQPSYVVQTETDGFKKEVLTTHSYPEAVGKAREHGNRNTASYYAIVRIFQGGVPIFEENFRPYSAGNAFKGD